MKQDHLELICRMGDYTIKQNAAALVVLFYKQTCSACILVKPIYEKAILGNQGNFFYIDIDTISNLPHFISPVPTVFGFKNKAFQKKMTEPITLPNLVSFWQSLTLVSPRPKDTVSISTKPDGIAIAKQPDGKNVPEINMYQAKDHVNYTII
jgi:hypothetical protein